MSRAVFFNIPADDHIQPTLSLVAELKRRGEQITYFATRSYQPAIEQTGALFRAYEDLPHDLLSETNPLLLSVRMAEACRQMLPGLLEQLRAEQPDYLIYDSRSAWGWYAAQILKLPAVASMTLLMLNSTILIRSGKLFPTLQQTLESLPIITRYRNVVMELEQTYGIPGPGITDILNNTGALTISYTSALFQPYAASLGNSFRFVGPAIDPILPTARADNLPLVVCDALCDALAYQHALTDESWRFAVADRAALPGRLPQAAVFITRGTMNAAQTALYYHVPLVVVPQTIEQSLVGQQIVNLGAGLQIDEPDPEQLRSAVERLLTTDDFRRNAATIGDSLRAAGGYRRAADEILAFVARYRPA